MTDQLFKCRFAILVVVGTFLLSCSPGDDNDNPPEDSIKVTMEDLVGTWTGTVSGTLGSANTTIVLAEDGTITAETDSDILCPFEGDWSIISGTNFRATANDECDDTSITLSAPASATILSGTWSASSGNNGSFSIRK